MKFRNQKRDNYMSLADLVQDLTTDSLITLLGKENKFKNQMVIISEIEQREEIKDELFYELLENCNGI